jgi:hypothetical protein
MKSLSQNQFIRLRALGYSFDDIARKIEVSKPTLIKWSKTFQSDIEANVKQFDAQLLDELKIARKYRLAIIAQQFHAISEEISKRDFCELSLDKLLKAQTSLISIIDNNDAVDTKISKKEKGPKEVEISDEELYEAIFDGREIVH